MILTQATEARLAQSVERQALNLMVEGSSPSVGAFYFSILDVSFHSWVLFFILEVSLMGSEGPLTALNSEGRFTNGKG